MSSWCWVYKGYDPAAEPLREALCTLGNGYFATRGAASECAADGVHYPGTYLAGGYNRRATDLDGEVVENESLVNFPNWLPLAYRMKGGPWLTPEAASADDHLQELDMGRGELRRHLRFVDGAGRTLRVEQRRFVHLAEPHLAGVKTVFTAEGWSGQLEVRTALDGRVRNGNVHRYRRLADDHLLPRANHAADRDTLCLEVETNQSGIRMAQAARTRVYRANRPVEAESRLVASDGYIGRDLTVELADGEPVEIEKIVALYSSRDNSISDCLLEAVKAAGRASDFDRLAQTNAVAWGHLWRRFDLTVGASDSAATDEYGRVLRLHLFHLLQTTSPNTMDLDVGVPARGLHGEAYRGHVLWDELFVFPMLNYRLPEITRALLMYRYRRLGEARHAAREEGMRGAIFPWQSGSNGREESQSLHLNPVSGRWIPDNSRLQRHVNSAIAYNIWQYYQVTRDIEFMSFYGAEMILEIARFWADCAALDAERQRYVIRGVMGPDEFHEGYPGSEQPGLDNNAYTNVTAAWVLSRALELPSILPEERYQELIESLDIREDEFRRWDDISRGLFIPFHGEGIISQFEGYEDLDELDWERYRMKYGDIQRLDRILKAEGDSPDRYKASKQADVLMLFYIFSSDELRELFSRLGYPFGYETIPRNMEYYISRTSHGSTLSRVVHSWVLARSDRPRSWRLFTQALESDVKDIQNGTTREGIHLGAMAGTVDLLQRGYTGIEVRGDALHLSPMLPEELDELAMYVRYRGQSLRVEIRDGRLHIRAKTCNAPPVDLVVREEKSRLAAGDSVTFDLAR